MNGWSTPDHRAIAAAQRKPAPVWLTPRQVCARIPGMTIDTLTSLREHRQGPAYYKPNLRAVLYQRADVDAWAEEMQSKLEAATG